MAVVKVPALFLLLVVAALLLWRGSDALRAGAAWARLAGPAEGGARSFDLAMIADLPEPAQRYFRFTIAPGTRLGSVAVFEMEGQLGLGDKSDPKYQPMRARQILAPPHGLVWRMRAGAISGSDGATPDTSWTRFWLFHLLPVVRISGDPDHHRSAFGRVVAEAAIWTPAALLPSDTVTWSGLGPDTARATFVLGSYTQWVDVTVDADGAPVKVRIERWSNANPDKVFRLQPFGGFLGEPETFGGYRIPTRIEGGNLIDTEGYFPFFRAKVTALDFP